MKKLMLGFAGLLAVMAFSTTTLTAEDADCSDANSTTEKPMKCGQGKCGEGKCGGK